jgi:hypothetical protein
MNALKRITLWDYARGTWQYDVFCLLIIAFIFLSPKAWFDNREKLATQTSRVIVKSEDISPDRSNLEKRVRELSGNLDAEIVRINEIKNENGEMFYEIDIR